MNKRQVNIISRVVQDSKYYIVPKLSEMTGKSIRTTYNDLNDINRFLAKNNIRPLIINDGEYVSADNKYRNKIQTLVSEMNFYDYELNSEERMIVITYILLFAVDYVTIQQLSDMLFCSKSTITKDMKELQQFLDKKKIYVDPNKTKGFKLRGDERNIRLLFIKFMESNRFVTRMFFENSRIVDISNDDREFNKKSILRCLLKNELSVTNASFELLTYYCLIMLNRIKNNNIIQNDITMNSKSEIVMLAQGIAQQILSTNVQNIDCEINFLTNFLSCLQYIKKPQNIGSIVTVQLLVSVFIEDLSENIGVNLSDDRVLFDNLCSHMLDILGNVYRMGIISDELAIFMEKNPDLIKHIKASTYVFETYASRQLSNVEVGYIALHISSALERKKHQRTQNDLNVLLICNSGIGTSQLLKSRIMQHYSFSVKDIIPIYELDSYDLNNIDLIISTVELPTKHIPHVEVSLQLEANDLHNINKIIEAMENVTISTSKDDIDKRVEEIVQVIEPYLFDYQDVITILETNLKSWMKASTPHSQRSLSDYLTEDMILLDEDASDWKEAIKLGISPLLSKAMVTDKFYTEIINSIESFGAYVLIGNNIAFPHAGFDHGAKMTGFSLVRLAKPIEFGDSGRMVEFIFTISAADNETHLNALFSLIDLANDDETVQKLQTSSSKEDIRQAIIDFEKNH